MIRQSRENHIIMISVIVAVYNIEDYVEQCIQSIIAQTFTDIEIILVDDGSTDSGGTICDRYGDLDHRIRVIHQKNSGLSAARNVGLDLAIGQWISFVDGDDFLDCRMLEKMHLAAEKDSSDLVMCGYYEFRDDEHIRTVDPSPQNADLDAFWGFAHSRRYILGCNVSWNKLYHRHLFDNLRFTTGILCEDANILYQLISRCRKISFVRKPLYYYRIRQNSIMHSPYSKRRARVMYDYLDRAEKLCEDGNQQYAFYAWDMAFSTLKKAMSYLKWEELTKERQACMEAYHRLSRIGLPISIFRRLQVRFFEIAPSCYMSIRGIAVSILNRL